LFELVVVVFFFWGGGVSSTSSLIWRILHYIPTDMLMCIPLTQKVGWDDRRIWNKQYCMKHTGKSSAKYFSVKCSSKLLYSRHMNLEC